MADIGCQALPCPPGIDICDPRWTRGQGQLTRSRTSSDPEDCVVILCPKWHIKGSGDAVGILVMSDMWILMLIKVFDKVTSDFYTHLSWQAGIGKTGIFQSSSFSS